MKIDKSNYEAFFLDFHEGNLSEEAKREVLAFVNANPDLKDEFESFETIFIEQSANLEFPGKENLKKNPGISVLNYKTWLVAYVEGDLNPGEISRVEKFISENPSYGQELEILRRTKILPDHSIRFSGKSTLKKGGVLIPMWVRIAVAACLVFGVMAYFFIQNKPESKFANELQPSNKIAAPAPELTRPPVAEIKTEVPVKNNAHLSDKKPIQKKPADVKVPQDLAANDYVKIPVSEKPVSDQLLAEHSDKQPGKDSQDTKIVINEGISNDSSMKKLVVLDDNDLAELGLKEKPIPNSKLADAVNSVGKLFNVNAHYDKSQEFLSKPTETWALGPLKIKRTVTN